MSKSNLWLNSLVKVQAKAYLHTFAETPSTHRFTMALMRILLLLFFGILGTLAEVLQVVEFDLSTTTATESGYPQGDPFLCRVSL
jgi:hypothetical protein